MNKDIYIWIAILLTVALSGEKDGIFKSTMRWITLIIVLADMYLYFS